MKNIIILHLILRNPCRYLSTHSLLSVVSWKLKSNIIHSASWGIAPVVGNCVFTLMIESFFVYWCFNPHLHLEDKKVLPISSITYSCHENLITKMINFSAFMFVHTVFRSVCAEKIADFYCFHVCFNKIVYKQFCLFVYHSWLHFPFLPYFLKMFLSI